jgi:hypothetical protein
MAEMSSQTMHTDETRLSRNVPGPEALTTACALAGDDTRRRDELGRRMLDNAEKLLQYAVEGGIQVQPGVVEKVMEARRLGDGVLDNKHARELIDATTELASMVKPVTIESLNACESDAKDTIQKYKRTAYKLAALIIPLAVLSFIMTGISNTITAELKIANDLAVKLHTQIDTSAAADSNTRAPVGSLSDLQQFAVAMRAIYSRARQLKWFIPPMVPDPFEGSYDELELNPALDNLLEPVQKEVKNKTRSYQKVRLYATGVQDVASVFWGAISTCVLPVLYALLGACAYLLQAFSDQLRTRTFTLSDATTARFIIAAIGGMVVGLFNNFTLAQGASVSPLAIAFLVGYAADIFFSFLAQRLPKSKSS